MARIARVVVPDCWHHVTQRGNHQETVFFEDADRAAYLRFLVGHCRLFRVRLTGYCLMGNHVHLLLVPETPDGLAKTLGRAHTDYSRWLNLRLGQTGHVWQNRYFSCPLDEQHQWEALRYVELNPVRAGLVDSAAEWAWSSAAAHCGADDPTGLLDCREWRPRWTPGTWREALAQGFEDAAMLERLREATRTGRPAGDEDFLNHLEASTKRLLRPQKRGPKERTKAMEGQLELGVW
jgi:putative transposase